MTKTIVLAAGGTGGHLFPAEALAQELLGRGHNVVIFTDKRGEAFKSLGDRVQIHVVKAGYFKAGLVAKAKAFLDIGAGILQSRKLLKSIKPDAVVGFGGYPSFPGVFAAQGLGIPTILHEQNGVLGKANAVLVGKAADIATSLPATKGIAAKNEKKIVHTGNPVRAPIIAVRDAAYPGLDGDVRVLVTGGSQGAKIFSDIVPAAVEKLPKELQSRLFIAHQCREETVDAAKAAYAKTAAKVEIKSFFNDMAERLAQTHLFIGRSGASTVAEIGVVGRPAIFVPYKHADMQQKFNAQILSDKGGAWMMMADDFTPDALAQKLAELMQDTSKLTTAAQAAKACGQPQATQNLANVVETRLKGLKK